MNTGEAGLIYMYSELLQWKFKWTYEIKFGHSALQMVGVIDQIKGTR